MKVIITGSTGMVGKGVLLECLKNDLVEEILLVNRKPIGVKGSKLKEVIIKDFFELDAIKKDLKGYDACFFCLGTTSLRKKEAEYHKITVELTTLFATIFIQQNADSVFCFVSGAGTDSSEKGNIMWARIKGKAENSLLAMPFKSAYMFRPGYIQPLKGIKSKTNWYSLLYALFSPIYHLLKHFPGAATNTVNIGKAMINAASGKCSLRILGNKEINKLATRK
jgi:uncharacterized protein YbjT (DUF2867 family)